MEITKPSDSSLSIYWSSESYRHLIIYQTDTLVHHTENYYLPLMDSLVVVCITAIFQKK